MLLDKENHLTSRIIGFCFEIHSHLGCGFDEKTYHRALIQTLKKNQIKFDTEKIYPILFEDINLGSKRLDFVIEDKVILEVKSVKDFMSPLFRSQLMSYLKISKIKVGLLVNFGNASCEVKRLLNDN